MYNSGQVTACILTSAPRTLAELVIDQVGWAPSEPPDGFKYVLDVPLLETAAADLLNLVGNSILHAFDEKVTIMS